MVILNKTWFSSAILFLTIFAYRRAVFGLRCHHLACIGNTCSIFSTFRHAHKSTVMDLRWNDNGNWLVTASRDHLLKVFDLRNLSEEIQVFRGHKKEASAVAWHPIHEGLFASGGSDGSILFWNVG